MHEEKLKLVFELINKPIWKLTIGPLGINMHFGEKIDNKYFLPTIDGEISLWIQCNTRIIAENKEVIFSHFPQEETEIGIYKKYLEGKTVIDAEINNQDKSLHIKFDSSIIFIAYPGTIESEECWIIYDHRIQKPPGIVVYTDGIEIAE